MFICSIIISPIFVIFTVLNDVISSSFILMSTTATSSMRVIVIIFECISFRLYCCVARIGIDRPFSRYFLSTHFCRFRSGVQTMQSIIALATVLNYSSNSGSNRMKMDFFWGWIKWRNGQWLHFWLNLNLTVYFACLLDINEYINSAYK